MQDHSACKLASSRIILTVTHNNTHTYTRTHIHICTYTHKHTLSHRRLYTCIDLHYRLRWDKVPSSYRTSNSAKPSQARKEISNLFKPCSSQSRISSIKRQWWLTGVAVMGLSKMLLSGMHSYCGWMLHYDCVTRQLRLKAPPVELR